MELKSDFDKINDVLAKLIDEVQSELAQIWPLLKCIDWFAGRMDEALARYGMNFARDAAWQFALDYSQSTDKQGLVSSMDQDLHPLGLMLVRPGILLRVILLVIRVTERGDVTSKISVFE